MKDNMYLHKDPQNYRQIEFMSKITIASIKTIMMNESFSFL
jgi:hypothetical protein